MKNVKYYLILSLIISFLYSCSYDDEGWTWDFGDPDYVDKTFFSPPAWIIGKWEASHPIYAGEKVVFIFTSDNVVEPFWGDLNDFFNDFGRYGVYYNVEEAKSSESYRADINMTTSTYNFRFQKIDTETIIVEEGFRDGPIELKKTE